MQLSKTYYNTDTHTQRHILLGRCVLREFVIVKKKTVKCHSANESGVDVCFFFHLFSLSSNFGWWE